MYFFYLAASFLIISALINVFCQFKLKTPWWMKLGVVSAITGETLLFYFLWVYIDYVDAMFGQVGNMFNSLAQFVLQAVQR